jgi:hypothetical protein
METQQGGDLGIGDKHDVATIAAVAAVGTRERLELFSANGDTSVAAVAGAKVQRHLVNKSCHDDCSLLLMNSALKNKGEPKLAPVEKLIAVLLAGIGAVTPPAPRC